MLLLEDNYHSSTVGKQLLALFESEGFDIKKAHAMLIDMFGGESPKTVTKRIGALQRFVLFTR